MKTLEINLQYFLERVTVDGNECWNWNGAQKSAWYGNMKHKWISTPTHRMSYAVLKAPIPEWLCVCHKCDNPLCCNPDHLFLGTHQDNMDDKVRKWRASVYRTFWNKSNSKRVSIDGKEFTSMVAAGKHFWISDNGVRKRFKGRIVYLE